MRYMVRLQITGKVFDLQEQTTPKKISIRYFSRNQMRMFQTAGRMIPLVWMILLLSIVLLPVELVAEGRMPFHSGERLTYELRWGIIPAGEAVMEVMPMRNKDGQEVYHFQLTAKSNEFIDMFYKVRDYINAYTDKDVNHSLLYTKDQLEGKTRRDITVHFDWGRMLANYSNFNREERTVDLVPGVLDPLSAFYFVRLSDLVENTMIECPVTDGKKVVIGRAKIGTREIIETKYGKIDSFLVEPELQHIGGVFEKSPEARMLLWVSADEQKYLVRMKSKVVVGSFVADLIRVETIK